MRVISGKMRGLKLESLDSLSTRPTLDKVKQAIFNMLFDKTYDAFILDLFSGSGAMGIEALSRYGQMCVFVDNNKAAVDIINKNIEKAKAKEKSRVICTDYASYLNQTEEKFDVIFIDPPYNSDFVLNALDIIHKKDILNDDALIVVESSRDNIPVFDENYGILKQKFYGTVCVSLLEAKWKK